MSLDAVKGGGTAERTFQLARHMARLGHDCTVLTTEIGMTPERRAALEGCAVVALPVLSGRFFVPSARRGEIDRLVAATDVAHLMNHWTLLNALVYRSARRFDKPYAVCPAGALAIFGRSRLLKQAFNALIGREIIRRAQAHIAIADNEIGQFEAYGVPADRIVKIPNGVNPEDLAYGDVEGFRRQAGLGDAPYLLFVGRLNPIKGPDLLLKAFYRVASTYGACHLVFAGPDEGMGSSLRSDAERMGLGDRVHFIGYLGGQDKAAAYRGASLVVVPSRQEAMSLVVLEAGICGRPVLMTDQCGFPVLDRVGGGVLVPATDNGLAEGLRDMMGDAGRMVDMGGRLKGYVAGHYSWEAIALRYESLFDGLLRGAPSAPFPGTV
jgi:glycosyltransferase involved in cell wall biosynthesis